MKNWTAIIFVVLLVLIWNVSGFDRSAIAETVDVAILSPADSTITAGSSENYTFSVVNDKSFVLKEYSAIFSYEGGLSINDLTATPAAATVSVNASKNQLQLKWTDVAPGVELTASFSASAGVGIYHISPYSIVYQDNNKKRHAGACNAATLIVERKAISAPPPRNFRSSSGDGFIDISWDTPAMAPLVGYMIYRRTSSTEYSRLTDSPINYLSYKDTSVHEDTTYYYAVKALDAYGNESSFLTETAETYFDLKKLIINRPAVAAAAAGDINGDGNPDIVIGLPSVAFGKGKSIEQTGAVEIYYGGNTTGIPDVTLRGENDKDRFGFSLTVTDMNNDGYDDLVVGAPYYSPATSWPVSGAIPAGGRIYIYKGGQTFSTSPARTLDGDWSYGCGGGCYYLYDAENFGHSVASAGDVNGDGFKDVAVGAPFGGMDRSGSVFLIYGSQTLGNGRIEIRGPDASQYMGAAVASSGDVNGDSRTDVLTCGYDPSISSSEGKMYLYYGQTFGPALSVKNSCLDLAMADINGDGYADMAASTDKGIDIYYGGPQTSGEPSFTFFPKFFSPTSLASIGDLNKDGYDDLVGSGPNVYFGSANGENTVDITRTGLKVVGVGDVDGDGIKEAFVTDSNNLYVYSFASYLSLPNIEINEPAYGAVTPLNTAVIEGRVKGAFSSVKVGGVPASVSPEGVFSATISLAEGNNYIEILVETPDGKVGKRLLYLSHVNVPPLAVSITSPSNGAVVNNYPVTVTGNVSDETAEVMVNGIQATISGTTFSAPGLPLQEGPNTVTASAVDGYEQTATDAIVVTLVTKGTIAGTVTDAVADTPLPDVEVTVSDNDGDHNVVTGSEGKYLIEGVSQGAITAAFSKVGYIAHTYSGNATAGQTVTLDAQLNPAPPLTLTITSPQDGAVVNVSPLTVTGNVSSSAQVTVNGTQAAMSGATFSVSVPLADGSNSITATATGEYGQTISKTISVTKVTSPAISEIDVSDIAADSATITWATDQPSDSLVEYGTTMSYGSFASDIAMVTEHSILLTNLVPGAAYHFVVKSVNGYGFLSSSEDFNFTTSAFQATFLGDYGNVAVMEVTGDYDARNPDGSMNYLPRQEIAKQFIKNHTDDYDFMIIFSDFDFVMPESEAKAFYLGIKNDVMGIGQQIFDNSQLFGSNGKLQGTIDMGNVSRIASNPTDPKFEETLTTLAHEQMHRWGASVKFRDGSGNLSSSLLGKDGEHWSYLLDSDASVMYGNDWQDNGDGTFTSTGSMKYYSPLDLYLMGVYDKAQVPPMLLIDNPAIDPAELPAIGATITGAAKYLSIDDIIAAEGARIPDASSSQKSFRTAFILITAPDTFTGNELPGIEAIRSGWAGRFAQLTGGNAAIADVAPAISLSLSSPSDGDTITGPDVTVKGAFINTTGNETGVMVNGVVATVYGDQFVATHVPLTEGANTLTITAADTVGTTASTSLMVNSVTGDYIRLTTNIESGIAPLEVTVRIDGTFSIDNSNMDVTGPAAIESIDNPAPDEYTMRMKAEGIYYFTASVTGPDGKTYQDTVAITVMNQEQLDRLLKAKWEGMKDAMRQADIEKTLDLFLDSSKDQYREIFGLLQVQMPTLASEMRGINFIELYGNVAEYFITRPQRGTDISYFIYFAKDGDGIWKIDRF